MPARTCLLIAVAFLLLAPAADLPAAAIKPVIGTEGAGENLLKPDAWRSYGKGFDRDGETFVCDNAADVKVQRGVCQTVTLNQTVPQPIVATAWSKAEGVGGTRNADYSVYIDLVYADGAPLYGQTAAFSVGSHDWEKRTVRIFPARPVKQLTLYLLLRSHAGKAHFRGPELRAAQAPGGMAWFDGVAVSQAGATAPAARFLVRDVAAGSDFVDFQDGRALGLKLEAEKAPAGGGGTFWNARLTDTTGKDRAVTLVYTWPVEGDGWRWLGGIRQEAPAVGPSEYASVTGFSDVGSGRLSSYPLAAVAKGKTGRAIAIDMGQPAFFRVGYSAGRRELYVAYDLALVPERPTAAVRFTTFDFDGTWGFRGAVAELYRLFPDYFRCRTPQQGVWMPFHAIRKVEGWEDFGFRFKEGNDETAWDDAHDILTFRYTEPLTWWMSMAANLPRTPEAAEAEARRLAETGNRQAQAVATSGYRGPDGRLLLRMEDRPWCNGGVWSMNSSPDLKGDVTDFKVKWNPTLREPLYGPNRKGDLDGEYVDSSEGYITAELDYAREHFAAARAPLVFAADTHRPAAFRGLIAYEYVRAIADDVHGMGKLMMANGTPDNLCWLAPWLDVMGTETDWNQGRRWRPMSDAELTYRRVLCGPKPFCFLMNTNFDEFPAVLTEKFMRRCLAYGMFPGFFSANASTKQYFSQPALYNRDRPLFKKYVPLTKRVAEAGWRPIPEATSDNPKVYVERFGEKLLTIFNDSAERQTATIALTAPRPAKTRELLSGTDLTWQDGRTTLTLEPEDVAVIEWP